MYMYDCFVNCEHRRLHNDSKIGNRKVKNFYVKQMFIVEYVKQYDIMVF